MALWAGIDLAADRHQIDDAVRTSNSQPVHPAEHARRIHQRRLVACQEKAAARRLQRAAVRRLELRGTAADVIIRVAARRLARKRDLACRLLQWTWRRRHLLPARGVRWPMIRPVPRCLYGTNLASAEEFARQRRSSAAVLEHYRTYVRIFERLAGESLVIGDLCASEGGQSAGIEALGARVRALDVTDQPLWRAKFGDAHFVVGDACNEVDILRMGP